VFINNQRRVNALKENIEIANQGYFIYNDRRIDLNVPSTKLISVKEILDYKLHNETKFKFVHNTTIGAVFNNPSKCCVLNFASYKTPGGGVLKGYNSQEESLCYPSNLYTELLKFKSTFYDKHINEGLNYGLYTSEALYSENISVFRTEGLEVMSSVREMNVITMAAPYAEVVKRYRPNLVSSIYKSLEERCKRVLEIASANNQEYLILGAFGCGVFGNDINDLIGIWYKLFNNEFRDVFKEVVFAIPEENNLDKFKIKFIK